MREWISYNRLAFMAVLVLMLVPLAGGAVGQERVSEDAVLRSAESLQPLALSEFEPVIDLTPIVWADVNNPLGLVDGEGEPRDDDVEGRGCSASTTCPNGTPISCSCPGGGVCGNNPGVSVVCICTGAPDTTINC